MREPSFGYIFKIILKIMGALFLVGLIGLCLTSVVMLFILGGSAAALLAWFAGVWNNIAQYNNLQPNTTASIPTQAIPAIVQNPNVDLFPTNEIIPSISPYSTPILIWHWQAIPLYGYKVELPDGWYVEEERLSLPSGACNLGHDLANYKIFNLNGNETQSIIQVQFLCWARGGTQVPLCPNESQILDESLGIIRSKISENEYHYGHFTRSNSVLYCFDGWPVADGGDGMTVNEIADYTQNAGTINPQVIDRIVTSIKPISGSFVQTPTIIMQPPTWTPTPTMKPSPTRTKVSTWTPINTPGLTPIQNTDMHWITLPAVGLKVEMPISWHTQEMVGNGHCLSGHPNADYLVTSDDGGDLTINLACASGDRQLPAACSNLTILDNSRFIGRENIVGDLLVYYAYYFYGSGGELDCPGPGWQIADMNVRGTYSSSIYKINNIPLIDQIMLSIQEP